eukprot:5164657-Amphidinium_carterae.2
MDILQQQQQQQQQHPHHIGGLMLLQPGVPNTCRDLPGLFSWKAVRLFRQICKTLANAQELITL